jgi:hypothetical protein
MSRPMEPATLPLYTVVGGADKALQDNSRFDSARFSRFRIASWAGDTMVLTQSPQYPTNSLQEGRCEVFLRICLTIRNEGQSIEGNMIP